MSSASIFGAIESESTTPQPEVSYRAGDRVEFAPDMIDLFRAGMPKRGTQGTVAKVHGAHGLSVYPDPQRSMVFVRWDSGEAVGVGRNSVNIIG